MTGLTGNGQFKGLNLQILHESLYAIGDDTEVVVVHLLVLRTFMAHERTTSQHQVWTGRIQSFIHKEILLFPT